MTIESRRGSIALTVGKINFLNTLPFFYSENGWTGLSAVRFSEGSPREINDKMAQGEIDLALISSLAYALDPEKYLILPEFCIAAREKARSVILYSREPLERLNGSVIALSSKSLSAASLVKVCLKLRFGFENRFVDSGLPPQTLLKEFPACLLIGDEALFFRPAGVHSYDLSEIWWQWTGFPFCFALWAVRKDVYSRQPDSVLTVHELLRKNFERNFERPAEMTGSAPFPAERKAAIIDYLRNLEYRLTEPVVSGLRLFYQYAGEIGLVSREVPLNIIEPLQRTVLAG